MDDEVLIVGAGPTGLAAALFLSEYDVPVRIIDKLDSPSTYSKAFGINARTLTLLKQTGVTEELLGRGLRMHALNIWHKSKRVLRIDLSNVDSPYNFMLINPQSNTEKILAHALSAKGINVERNTSMEDIKVVDDNTAIVNIKNAAGTNNHFESKCVLGADGAHSIARAALEIDFPGSTFPEPWYFYDVELELPYKHDEGHVFLYEKCGVFVIRISENIWRIGSNLPNLLEKLPKEIKVGKIFWETSFNINHRVVSEFSRGPVYLAGDSAHLHSPVGGRGMNLGIEDAFVFAALQANNQLSKYSSLRHSCVKKVVDQVERMSELPRGSGGFGKIVRMAPSLVNMMFPIFAPSMGKWILGLDHPVIPNSR